MTKIGRDSLIGAGIYAVPEASRLTGVSTGRIRRWLKGYSFSTATERHTSPPVWAPQLPVIEGRLALSFLDLIEVRFVNAFLNEGVSWRVLRAAALRAQKIVGRSHPFCTRRFLTDGRLVFTEVQNDAGESSLLELTKSQHYFKRIIQPYLRDLEFERGEPARWWPLGLRRRVVIDPARGFGQPIIAQTGIPTSVLAQAVQAAGAIKTVASWYEVDAQSIRDAIAFERLLRERRQAA